jgi:DNA-binding winged helix-turn-helix (wHTH) protein
MTEIKVCRARPTVIQIDAKYIRVYQQNVELTAKWTLPDDPESRVVLYLGRPLCLSRIRFKVLKELLFAEGEPVSYREISYAGWEEIVDHKTLEAAIYWFNRLLKREGIPEFISCSKETVFFV